MSRIQTKTNGKKLFCPFIMSGYPDYDVCLEIMIAAANAGADIIEIGMPFTDPTADGPVIQEAGNAALRNGSSVARTIDLVKKFREQNDKIPLVWMGYYNPVYHYGVEMFAKDASEAGIDGVLIVDLPPEEANDMVRAAKIYNLDTIRLVTPVTPMSRLPVILEDAGGFLYFVSVAGITGTKEAEESAIKAQVERIKAATDLPVVVGFGINTPEKARSITAFADGVVVGSALIKEIMTCLDNRGNLSEIVHNFISRFVQDL